MELLVVMAIIIVLASFSVPAFEHLVKGSRVTIAGRMVMDDLNLARQTALSKSLPVEVRLLMLPEANLPADATPTVFRALQAFSQNENGIFSIGKMVFFPQGIVVETDTSYSSIFDTSSNGPLPDPNIQTPKPDEPIAKYGTNYRYISFGFRVNGETNLKRKPAFLTLVSQSEKKRGSVAPRNFVTVQIDPVNGRVHSYRP